MGRGPVSIGADALLLILALGLDSLWTKALPLYLSCRRGCPRSRSNNSLFQYKRRTVRPTLGRRHELSQDRETVRTVDGHLTTNGPPVQVT